MITLKRCQLKKGPKPTPLPVDITAKSAKAHAQYFAPTWEMVNGHKAATLSHEAYEALYTAILDRAPQQAWEWLAAQNEGTDTVIVACYCRDDWWCHTKLLMAYAERRFPETFKALYPPPSQQTTLDDL
jgi:uncharacterized protein YeaO (DUF488 family)